MPFDIRAIGAPTRFLLVRLFGRPLGEVKVSEGCDGHRLLRGLAYLSDGIASSRPLPENRDGPFPSLLRGHDTKHAQGEPAGLAAAPSDPVLNEERFPPASQHAHA